MCSALSVGPAAGGDAQLTLSDADAASMEGEASRLGYADITSYLLELHRRHTAVGAAEAEDDARRAPTALPIRPERAFETEHGVIYRGDSAALMQTVLEPQSVDLVMTSPPFGLVRKKDYGNEDADRYVKWFEQFADGFVRVLKPNGSLVIDIGGAWKKGQPTRSLYHYELLIMLARDYGFHLAQEFYWWNPAKLPTPAEWVNIRRVRVKDAVNSIFWLSLTPYPRASNRRVLQRYSASMEHLLKHGYKAKRRPSGHDISTKFGRNNQGAIPPNLIALANTESNSSYQRYCREKGLPEHPARFPSGIPAFFIHMLSDPGDLVFDPFGGSCMTGEVAERMGRRWVCCEMDAPYVEGAKGRFADPEASLPAKSRGTKAKRTKPYEIFPPNLSLVDEQRAPLAQDGGRQRPPLTQEWTEDGDAPHA